MIRLTQTVQKGGCAAKVAATELQKILSQVQFPKSDENLLVDGGLFDDAAIYKINSDLAMVQTLDFFTPIVDTPRTFGAIAAANAVSDVYAMGGIPKTAMGILAFPLATMDSAVIVEVMQGACDLLSKTNVNLVGGHSIDDDSLKFGLSVTGYVHPQHIWSNTTAKVGDVLILTKALGTGTLTAGLKRGEYSESDIQPALQSMMKCNAVLDLLNTSQAAAIHSATDITGFGLAGHAMQIAKASAVTLYVHFQHLPIFDLAFTSLGKGFLTKAHRTNAAYARDSITVHSSISETEKLILFDPQTSGGLLLSVAADQAESILSSLRKRFHSADIIGKVIIAEPASVVVG
ncbi:selenide, water dikinase SelD [Nitrosomonas sp. Nm166]|uniref:selenide, water dikinase SelD n=1 Tax=Nitrosomonas sp. Nm166 TaxID=1881054 RepID=UPI0008E8E78C|nr:selenide, water dikinase SelD [Nitrosomonas sp. Nm166]SFF22383.1 selenide, water dikinase [Nitrosomonas sp. Nm166]